MTMQLMDRVAVVTGASNGLGRGIAEALAAAGAKTALAARRTEMLEDVASAIRKTGGTALPVTTDVTREDQVASLFRKTYEAYGRVDVLVNNAGVPTHVPVEDITLKYWQEVLDVNLTAAFLCSREAIKIMKTQTPQGGRIINIGSVSAKTPRPDSLPYTVTKFALQGMTHQLTMDGRKYGVVASILHPGATLSSFSTRRGRTKAGPGATPDDYVMAVEGRGEDRRADVQLAAGGEPVRGDDPTQPHAFIHRTRLVSREIRRNRSSLTTADVRAAYPKAPASHPRGPAIPQASTADQLQEF